MDIRIEEALPIGLIVNELLTNAFKYAFTIVIYLRCFSMHQALRSYYMSTENFPDSLMAKTDA